jgi:broad specificity phosphatase PhoE
VRLTLVRHGETDHNKSRLTLGRADVPLNKRGLAQAEAVGASFSATPPEAIYTSPLVRAADTAATISRATGVLVTIEPGLIEMDVGEVEHLTSAELRDRYPDFLRLWLSPEGPDARMPGGESFREVQVRAWAAIEGLRARHPDGAVVAVTHNFVILTLVCRALDLPLSSFRRVRQALAAKTVLDLREGQSTLLQLNDTAHLAAAGLADDLIGREARP